MPVLAIGILFVLVSCGNSYEENRRLSRAEKERLDSLDQIAFKVGVMPTLDCLPVYIAYEDSLFEKDSVRVHLKSFTCPDGLRYGADKGQRAGFGH
jgi:NitT/TauT family transport system substrate-binding protein